MAQILADRVRETSVTVGLSDFVLSAPVAGYQTFGAVMANGDVAYYAAQGATSTEWEVGLGTYVSATDTLQRTTVYASSASGAKVSFSSGTKYVFLTQPAEVSVCRSSTGAYNFGGVASRITGDFSNAVLTNRLAFQTSTVNSNTGLMVLPNGTATQALISFTSAADPTNASAAQYGLVSGAEARVASVAFGSGTLLPLTFWAGNSEKLRIAADATGTFTFGGTAPRITGDFSNATVSSRGAFQTNILNGATAFTVLPNGTSNFAIQTLYSTSDAVNASILELATGRGSNTEIRISSGITGTGTYLPMTFFTGGSERVRVDIFGSAGFGTVPPTSSGAGGIFGPDSWVVAAKGSNFHGLANAYFNAGWLYASTAVASRYSMQTGGHIWYTAPSGTVGTTITWSEMGQIAVDGTATLGGTSAVPAFKAIPVANQVNWISAVSAATGGAPFLVVEGANTDVAITLASKAAGAVQLCTGGGATLQVAVTHTASTNRYLTLTGSNGGNPTIGVSAGLLNFTPAVTTQNALYVNNSATTPAGGTASSGVMLGTVAIGMFWGSGAPTMAATQGSIYLRTDGSSTSTRLYVNTNGSTGWTNFTSAA